MKKLSILITFQMLTVSFLYGQSPLVSDQVSKDLYSLIDKYNEARDNSDTVLLKTILTADIDQLVSTGEWRTGIRTAIEGMMQSSANNPNGRKLTIEGIRLLNDGSGIVDCRYEISNADGTVRKMWSSFIVVKQKEKWRISAIRNMLPTVQQK
jgi:hypothetical protein